MFQNEKKKRRKKINSEKPNSPSWQTFGRKKAQTKSEEKKYWYQKPTITV